MKLINGLDFNDNDQRDLVEGEFDITTSQG